MNGLIEVKAPITIRNDYSALIEDFKKYADVAPSSLKSYEKSIKQFFLWAQQQGRRALTRQDVLDFKTYLMDSGKKSTTVQNYITALKIFYSWASHMGYSANIAEKVKSPKVSRDFKKDYLAADQVKNIIEVMNIETEQGQRDFTIFLLMVSAGLRTVEVARANIEDLRAVAGSPALYVQGKGKTDKNDFIILAPEIEKIIRNYLATYRKGAQGHEPLFTSTSNTNAGGRLTTRTISKVVKTAMQHAGYDSPRLTAHSLRHTAITLSLLAGQSIQEAKQFARHANIATTLIYDHSIEKSKNACSSAITGAIFKEGIA